jgi:large subunit ribosomal protein L4e
MSGRKTVNVYSITGDAAGSVPLPAVFDTPIRQDIIGEIYTNLAKNRQQPHATSLKAGVRPAAASWGTGRAKARVPRVNGSGSNRNGQAAYANFARGGHRFAPPTIQRRWFRPVPLKQRRYAVASAIAASGVVSLVQGRGHVIGEVNEIPIVVQDAVESIVKTKAAVAVLDALKVSGDVKRVINGKIHRSSKGKMRRSAFKTRRGPLVVYAKNDGIVKAFRNIPGVDLQPVTALSIYQLAPGATLGRLVVWSESAFKALDAIYESKKGFSLPRALLSNPDIDRIIESDEVGSVLRTPLQAFSVPSVRCPARIALGAQEWEDALDRIAEIRAAQVAKTRTPEAIKALFDEVLAVQPEAPANLSTQITIFNGYFDPLREKKDDDADQQLAAQQKAEAEAAAAAAAKPGGKTKGKAAAPAAAAAPAKGTKAPAAAKGGPAKPAAKGAAKGGAKKK